MSTPGLLFVFGEPGPSLTDVEFNDWYDNEHVPLRVADPTFSSWARLRQIDGPPGSPAWGAYYDLASYEATLVPPYSRLAATRSARSERSRYGSRTRRRRFRLCSSTRCDIPALGVLQAVTTP